MFSSTIRTLFVALLLFWLLTAAGSIAVAVHFWSKHHA